MASAKKKLNVAMIGYQFMGRAHSNAWRQVGRFFDLPLEPVLKVVCGRNQAEVEKAAGTLGWDEAAKLIENGIAKTIQQKRVTYDLERQMPGATKVGTAAFATAIIENMQLAAVAR